MKKSITISLLCLLLAGCAQKQEEVTKEKGKPVVGEFVYVVYHTIHVDRVCPRLDKSVVQFVKAEEWRSVTYSESNISFCPHCVSDEAYKYLKEIGHE